MSSHNLIRLTTSIYNTPHLLTPDSLNFVLDFLDERNSGKLLFSPTADYTPRKAEHANKIGVLDVHGALTYKPVMTMCGEAGTSYQSLENQVQEMLDEGVSTIVMNIASGGGQAAHVFETANNIRSMVDDAGAKLIAYADETCASAAYALAVIADEVIANPSASVGSIGALVALMDTSKAMEKAGLKRIYITSGKSKVPFDEDGSFKAEFIEELQRDIDRLNVEFASHVSEYSGLSTETIMGFEAKVFNAQEALEKGLVNAVMTNKEFTAYVANKHAEALNA